MDDTRELNICIRSAAKYMIDTGAGVIDSDYRGVVFVLLFNLSDEDFEGDVASPLHVYFNMLIPCFAVQEGDRIAQLIIEQISTPDVVEVEVCRAR